MTSALFSPFQLRALTLPNRIVVSPMCQYMSENGSANDWHLMHLGQFAMGAAGLVMTEATHVSAVGRISHRCLGLYSDQNESTLKRVFDFCRRHGVAKLGIQLAHAGRKGSVQPPAQGGRPLATDESPWITVAPSALPFGPGWHTPVALDRAGLRLADIDIVDMHEAFAAQVVCNRKALASRRFAEDKLGRTSGAVGEIDDERFNVHGGSIALGHPFAATGARMIHTVLRELKRRKGQFGLATACAAGGLGAAIVLEAA